MIRSLVVPFRRHEKAALDALLAQVTPGSRPFAAQLLCIRTHDHSTGDCIAAPRGYWPQVIPAGSDR